MPEPADPARRRLLAAAPALAAWPLLARAAPAGLRLSAATGELRLAGPDAPAAAILGYDGRLPGPVLRARRGEALAMDFRNDLDEPTQLHWHGLRQPADVASQPLLPAARTRRLVQSPDAGTLLYRPPLGRGEDQMRRGLAGLLLVDDAVTPVHDRELPLLLSEAPGGSDAPLLANGRPATGWTLRAGERLWLRLANATVDRVLRLALPDQAPVLVALDSQPCEPFPLDGGALVLAPGQRAELLWDVAATGQAIALEIARFGGTGLRESLEVVGPPARTAPLPPPRPLPANPLPQAMDFRRALRWDWAIGGSAAAPTLAGRPDREPPAASTFRARTGSVVVAAIRNDAAVLHAVHLQGHAARLLDGLDDGWKPYFIDTVLVAPGLTARIAFRADQPGRFLVTAQPINGGAGPALIAFDVG